jgi:hypothetical protein
MYLPYARRFCNSCVGLNSTTSAVSCVAIAVCTFFKCVDGIGIFAGILGCLTCTHDSSRVPGAARLMILDYTSVWLVRVSDSSGMPLIQHQVQNNA